MPRSRPVRMEGAGPKLSGLLQRRIAPATRKRVKVYRRQIAQQRAADYLEAVGVTPLLIPGSASEMPPDALDLAFLHRSVRAQEPGRVLEFGVGYSTLVLAHALSTGHAGERHPPNSPRLYVVDTSQQWIDNTRRKVPHELEPYIEFRQSRACASQSGGELCHFFEELPNIRPKFIYLDGPDPAAVEGDVHGLRFTRGAGLTRPPIGADILLYESTLRPGTTVVVDGRKMNAAFLRRALKRRWRVSANAAEKRYTFTLLE